MKRITFYTLLTALLALWTIAVLGAVPQLINFQGILRDGSGNPVANGNYTVTFKIYDAPAGGTLIFDVGAQIVATTNGLFSTALSVPESNFDGSTRWLSITVDPDVSELTPRTRLVSVGYSYRVGSVNGASGGNVFGDLTLHSTLKVGDLTGNVGRIEVTDGVTNTIIADGTNGKLTATSAGAGARLAIEATALASGASTATGVSGVADNPGSGDIKGGSFTTTAAGTGNHFGVYSEANATSGTASAYALFAKNNATTAGIHYGVVGQALGAGAVQNRALEGVASGATGLNIGVRGSASGTGAYSGRFENAKVRVGVAGTENVVDGNGDLYVEDELEVDGIAAFAAGTAAAPALTFSGDINTGIYNPAANVIGLATLGLERVRVSSAGDLGIGTTAPGSRLQVREDINGVAALTIENQDVGTSSQTRLQFVSEDGASGVSAISVFDNSSTSPATMRFTNNLTGGNFDFVNAGIIRMVIDQVGNVGIGTSAPNTQFEVVQSSNTPAAFDRTTNDGTIISLRQDGTSEGTISVAGTTVSYNAFTGSHYGWTEEVLERGELVTLTGINRNSHDDPKSEVIYGIKRSTVANDPACLGSYLALQEPSQPASPENPHLVMAVGNGDMWVTDEGRDIQPGDYLISSSTPGHAMKDDADKYPLGYVVARAAEKVDWSSVSETIGGRKHQRISVLYESFVRTSTASLTKAVEEQRKEIDELKAMVKALTAGNPSAEKKLFGEVK